MITYPTKLPKHWATKTLGEVCEVNIGKTPSRGSKKYWDEKKITNNIWLSIADFSRYMQGKDICDSREYLSDEGADIVKTVKKGTLLLTFKLTIGKVAFAQTEMRTNEAIASLNIKDSNLLNKEYLYYCLMGYNWDALTRGDIKVKGKTLNKQKLNNDVSLPLPPLSEQKEIVEILDSAFSKIDHAISSCQKALALSDELWSASLDEAMTMREGWATKTLGEVCEFQNGFAFKSSQYKDTGISLIRITNIQKDKIVLDNSKCIDSKLVVPIQYHIQYGDLLIAMSGATTGKIGIYQSNNISYLNQRVGKFIPKNILNQSFLYYFLKTKVDTMLSISLGSAQPNLSTEQIKTTILPLPPLEEQKEIVAKLDRINDSIQKLKNDYNQKIHLLKELKSSLLDSAFTGKLTNKETS